MRRVLDMQEVGILMGWNSVEEMANDFNIELTALDGIVVLLADYECGDYEGSAFVLFEKDGKLYEVNAGHCSCYGLEDQWNPEEVLIAELKRRTEHNSNHMDHKNELVAILELFEVLQNDADVIAVTLRMLR